MLKRDRVREERVADPARTRVGREIKRAVESLVQHLGRALIVMIERERVVESIRRRIDAALGVHATRVDDITAADVNDGGLHLKVAVDIGGQRLSGGDFLFILGQWLVPRGRPRARASLRRGRVPRGVGGAPAPRLLLSGDERLAGLRRGPGIAVPVETHDDDKRAVDRTEGTEEAAVLGTEIGETHAPDASADQVVDLGNLGYLEFLSIPLELNEVKRPVIRAGVRVTQ